MHSAPSRNLLRGALSPATAKEKFLEKQAERRHIVPGQEAQRKREFSPSGGANYRESSTLFFPFFSSFILSYSFRSTFFLPFFFFHISLPLSVLCFFIIIPLSVLVFIYSLFPFYVSSYLPSFQSMFLHIVPLSNLCFFISSLFPFYFPPVPTFLPFLFPSVLFLFRPSVLSCFLLLFILLFLLPSVRLLLSFVQCV